MVGWGVGGPQADGPLTLPSPSRGEGSTAGWRAGGADGVLGRGWAASGRPPHPALSRAGERDRLRVGVRAERMVGWGVGGPQADGPLTLWQHGWGEVIRKSPFRNV